MGTLQHITVIRLACIYYLVSAMKWESLWTDLVKACKNLWFKGKLINPHDKPQWNDTLFHDIWKQSPNFLSQR